MLKNNKTPILKQNSEICPIILTRKRKEIVKKKKDTCLVLHDAVTPLTTLLVSEWKWLPRYCYQRFEMSCKAFFYGKSLEFIVYFTWI